MKKLLAIISSIVFVLCLSACTSDDTPVKEQAGSSVESSEQTGSSVESEEVFGLNETAVFDELKFTASELKESKGENFFTPKTGNVFVGIKFTIENISKEEQAVSTLMLFDGYADDVKCAYSLNASCAFDDGSLDGNVAPGKKLVGWYALEVPEKWSTIELDIKADLFSKGAARFVFTK